MTRHRAAAEAYFRQPAKKLDVRLELQACRLPHGMQEKFEQLPESRRRAAFRIAIAPDLVTRQVIWNQVPAIWRPEVEDAVGLMLGAMLGSSPEWGDVEKHLDSVPPDLRATVRNYALEVYAKRTRPGDDVTKKPRG